MVVVEQLLANTPENIAKIRSFAENTSEATVSDAEIAGFLIDADYWVRSNTNFWVIDDTMKELRNLQLAATYFAAHLTLLKPKNKNSEAYARKSSADDTIRMILRSGGGEGASPGLEPIVRPKKWYTNVPGAKIYRSSFKGNEDLV